MLGHLHRMRLSYSSVRRLCSQVAPPASPALSKFIAEGRTTISRRFTSEDVTAFAELTGDRNPIHIDKEAAKRVGLPGAVVHGALLNGLVSALIAKTLPNCVVLNQELIFPQALLVNEEVSVLLEFDSQRKRFVSVKYSCRDSLHRIVMHGQAKLALMADKQETNPTDCK